MELLQGMVAFTFNNTWEAEASSPLGVQASLSAYWDPVERKKMEIFNTKQAKPLWFRIEDFTEFKQQTHQGNPCLQS